MKIKKYRYPTTIENDFSQEQIQKSSIILSQSLRQIHSSLIGCLSEHANADLTCILRSLIDAPINESSLTIIGWYFLNSLVPVPVAFLFLKKMINLLNTATSPQDEAFRLNHLFARSFSPKLYKYQSYCKALISNPFLQYYDNELYIAVSQFAHESVMLEYFETKYYFVLPPSQSYFQQISKIEEVLPLPPQNSNLPLKQNLFNSIDFARTLPPEQQKVYCVTICLTYPPTPVKIRFPQFLSAICSYVKLLILGIAQNSWESFEVHPQLERMGHWIGALTNSQGRPPPLHMLNIPLLLRESIQIGTLGNVMVFLIAFYMKVSSIYAPPNPITNLVLEILASVLHTPGIRTDIIQKINKLGEILKLDIANYFHRQIIIPPNSFDRHAQFTTDGGSTIFQPPFAFTPTDEEIDIPFCLNAYFHYVPNHAQLQSEQQEIFTSVQRIDKYYFADSSSHVVLPHNSASQKDELQCIVSLAIADSPILAKTASKLFRKVTKGMPPLDLAPIFRWAFPNKYIMRACLERSCFAAPDINALFAELLTNPDTAPIAKPRIIEFMPLCFEVYPDYQFSAVQELAQVYPKRKETLTIPMPSASHTPLLRSFLSFARSRDESARGEFTAKLNPASASHLTSLISFVFLATTKRNSPKTASAIDYSPIDSLCFALGKCAGRIDSTHLISNCVQAITTLAPSVINQNPNIFFRLVNGLFGWLHFKSKVKMIELLELLSPAHYPSFSICWIQLVMHRSAFPSLVKLNEPRPMAFCLNFVVTCLKLAVNYPDIVYRAVCRILMTISSFVPLFFVSYSQLFLEVLPLHYVQFRNIILGSVLNDPPTTCPPIGFSVNDTLKQKDVTSILNPILTMKEKDFHKYNPNTNNENFIIVLLKRASNLSISIGSKSSQDDLMLIPKFVWQFVFYCINSAAEFTLSKKNDSKLLNSLPIVNLLSTIFTSLNDHKTLTFFFESIVDQLRYPNIHTTFVSNLIMVLYQRADFDKKEFILVTLIKRIMCVTQPPQSLKDVYQTLVTNHELEVHKIFEDNNELDQYLQVEQLLSF